MKSLFMIGMGGSIEGANIEVHDMQLIVAESPEACYPEALKRWYGASLHIDSYTKLEYIDGYNIDWDIELSQNLYLIVYGGYNTSIIDEIHRYDIVIADNKVQAKQIAKKTINRFPNIDHVDNVVDVFENTGVRFGLKKGEYKFTDNQTTHTFVKLR